MSNPTARWSLAANGLDIVNAEHVTVCSINSALPEDQRAAVAQLVVGAPSLAAAVDQVIANTRAILAFKESP